MRQPTVFRPSFKSSDEVHDLIARRDAEKQRSKPKRNGQTTREEASEAGQRLVRGEDIRASLRCIYRWKLGSFIHRFKWVKAWPDGIAESALTSAVALANKAIKDSADENLLRRALEAFHELPYVRVPVASAFLMAMNREKFTILDRQAYKALGVKFRDDITEYIDYLSFCRQEAIRLGVTLEQYDRGLWQRGVELGRRKRSDCH